MQFDSIDYAIYAARNYGLRLIIPLTGTPHSSVFSIGRRADRARPADNYAYCTLASPLSSSLSLTFPLCIQTTVASTTLSGASNPVLLALGAMCD